MKPKLTFLKYIYIYALLSISFSNTTAAQEVKDTPKIDILTTASVFKPLIADPKWPRFTLAYQYYTRGDFNHHTFSPNFGAALPLIRAKSSNNISYEIGVHAGLFAAMDIESSPSRLINSDYFVGPTLAIQQQQLDILLRLSHTSSHLGDELILSPQGNNIKRINLSYETAEAIFGYNFNNGTRPFIGGGYIVNAEPSNYKTFELTIGLDYRHPEYYLGGYAKPILGIYSKTSKNFGWHPNISIKAGVELKDKLALGKALQVLLEYYNGNSMHGQFYQHREKYIGTSLNINF